MSFIVHGKIYYVRKTTSYHLFSTISDKKIVSIIFTRIFKHIHLRGLYKLWNQEKLFKVQQLKIHFYTQESTFLEEGLLMCL